jgi:hypothetical protein
MYERVVSEGELNLHGCELRLHRTSSPRWTRIRRSAWDVMCPRGESPLMHMSAITGEFVLGGQR